MKSCILAYNGWLLILEDSPPISYKYEKQYECRYSPERKENNVRVMKVKELKYVREYCPINDIEPFVISSKSGS